MLAGSVLSPGPASAQASTYHVSPDGSDGAAGTSASPFRTIGRATATAQTGDTILVSSGTYPETVTVPTNDRGVTLRGVGATQPIIDGEGARRFGFQTLADGLTIENFEVTGQTEAGVIARGSDVRVADNVIHHIGSPAIQHSTGVRLVQGQGGEIEGNRIHSVGPGGESMGIWLLQTKGARVAGNTVYLIRKEGVRDWQGLDNTITDNRFFLNWAGVSLATSTGSHVFNNYIYDNVLGVVAKHLSNGQVLGYWNTPAQWSEIWHNTIWRSGGAGIAIAQSGPALDYLDVRNNIFEDAGMAYIHDIPSLRGEHVVVDGNAYAPAGKRPSYIYKATWQANPGISSWEAYREQLGWDANGLRLDPGLVDPANGDLDYASTSPAASGSIELDSPFGNQLGARGLPPAPSSWAPLPMTPIASSSRGTWWTEQHLDETADDNQFSYWLSETNANEFVTYDFGRQRTFDHLVLSVFRHFDIRNIRGYRFEVSDDRDHWRTVLEGVNPDSAGSSYKYELPEPATGRYLRFTMRDTFCDSYEPRSGCGEYFVFSDLKAGTVTEGEAPPPPPVDPKLRLASKRALLTRSGDLMMALACRGPGSGRCRGSVRLKGVSTSRSGRRSTSPLTRRPVGITSGTRRTLRVRLNRAQTSALKRRGSKVAAAALVGKHVVASRTLPVRSRSASRR